MFQLTKSTFARLRHGFSCISLVQAGAQIHAATRQFPFLHYSQTRLAEQNRPAEQRPLLCYGILEPTSLSLGSGKALGVVLAAFPFRPARSPKLRHHAAVLEDTSTFLVKHKRRLSRSYRRSCGRKRPHVPGQTRG